MRNFTSCGAEQRETGDPSPLPRQEVPPWHVLHGAHLPSSGVNHPAKKLSSHPRNQRWRLAITEAGPEEKRSLQRQAEYRLWEGCWETGERLG